MRKKYRRLFLAAPVICLVVSAVFSDNPAVQTCYTADPAPLVHDGRVYMYTGQDSIGAVNSYLISNWKCYSSSDMVNWTDHGVIYSPKSVSWATVKDANASQVVYRNGKFYFYISTTASDGVAVGVAVSNTPIGPFKDTLGKPLITGTQMTGCNATHGWRGLDPTVYIDEDGQAYLYWGNNVLYWVKLNDNMISLNGSITCIPQNDPAFGPDYEEGPWFYKRDSLYYLLYPSSIPESIHYSTSTGPTGPWTYRSEIMPAQQGQGSSSTIHPGMCDFEGNSYFFYHNGALPGGGSYKRSVCIEQFMYNADGAIPKVPATSGGVTTGIRSLNPYDTVQAETICWGSGLKTSVCSEGGIQVDSIHDGDYIKVKGVDFGSGAISFDARVASATSSGNIELRLDSQTGTLAGTCAVTGMNGWQNWTTRNCTVTGATGVHDLYLRFSGASGLLFNFNWWKFARGTGTGIFKTGNKGLAWGGTIKVAFNTGTTRDFKPDLPQQLTGANMKVCLYDISGRQIGEILPGRSRAIGSRSLARGIIITKVDVVR